jgi:hypothetical protein
MQEPLENLSANAQRVHTHLITDHEQDYSLEEIAVAVDLREGEVANALRELDAAGRASETFGGRLVALVAPGDVR